MSNLITAFFILFGLFFFLIGTLGVLRFPDALTRAHGAAKCDTLGAVLCLTGLIIEYGMTFTSLKLVLIVAFLWSTNPTGTHILGKAIVSANKRAAEKKEGVNEGGDETHELI